MSKCSMSKKIESLRKQNEEVAEPSQFEPVFYVADLKGNEISSEYEYDTMGEAIEQARELSEKNPGTPYAVNFMCNVPVLFNGELYSEMDFEDEHPGFDEKRKVHEGLKAVVCGGDLEGTYDVEDLWQYSDGKSADYSDARKKGGLVPRAELDNQPTLPGYAGPMWDGDGLRYETWALYDQLSR